MKTNPIYNILKRDTTPMKLNLLRSLNKEGTNAIQATSAVSYSLVKNGDTSSGVVPN